MIVFLPWNQKHVDISLSLCSKFEFKSGEEKPVVSKNLAETKCKEILREARE